MSQIPRPYAEGTAVIGVRLLEEIEALLDVDTAEPPRLIAPVEAATSRGTVIAESAGPLCSGWSTWWRRRCDHVSCWIIAGTQEHCQMHDWLEPHEVHAVQRLRGWHRIRFGIITADARWLTKVRNLLDSLTLSLDSECDQELREAGYDPDLQAEIKARIEKTGYCGDCQWCRALRLRGECDTALDAAGHEGGVYCRAYVLGQSVEEANTAVYGPCIRCGGGSAHAKSTAA